MSQENQGEKSRRWISETKGRKSNSKTIKRNEAMNSIFANLQMRTTMKQTEISELKNGHKK